MIGNTMPVDELESLRMEIEACLYHAGKLDVWETFWAMFASKIMRERADITNFAADKVACGKFSICYDMAVWANSARKRLQEQANSNSRDATPKGGLTSV